MRRWYVEKRGHGLGLVETFVDVMSIDGVNKGTVDLYAASAQNGAVALGDRVAWLNDRPPGSQMARASSANAAGRR